ncbi:hypothetical protein ACOSQ2_017790 [Xanthoceras sorbifolium]
MRLKASELKDDPMPLLGAWFSHGKKLIYCNKIEETALPKLRGLTLPERCKFTIPERLRSIPLPGQWQFSRGWPDTYEVLVVRKLLLAVIAVLASVPDCLSAHTPSAYAPAGSSAYTPLASGDPSTDSRSASKATMSCNRVKQRSTITTMLTYPLKHQSRCMIKLMIRDLQETDYVKMEESIKPLISSSEKT